MGEDEEMRLWRLGERVWGVDEPSNVGSRHASGRAGLELTHHLGWPTPDIESFTINPNPIHTHTYRLRSGWARAGARRAGFDASRRAPAQAATAARRR